MGWQAINLSSQRAQVDGRNGCHPLGRKHCDDCDDALLRAQARFEVVRQQVSLRLTEPAETSSRLLWVLLQDEQLEDNHACRQQPPSTNYQCNDPENQADSRLSLPVKVRRPHPGRAGKPNGCDDNEWNHYRCEHEQSLSMNITRWPPPVHEVFLECEYDTSRRAERMRGGA